MRNEDEEFVFLGEVHYGIIPAGNADANPHAVGLALYLSDSDARLLRTRSAQGLPVSLQLTPDEADRLAKQLQQMAASVRAGRALS